METRLTPAFLATSQGAAAESILRACVHCGFCNATCPTYQLLGDELDGPRGRIYQIKQVLEGAPATRTVQLHLDRCLTCRNCETTCPSGVHYGHLVEIGREVVAQQVRRPLIERLLHGLLRAVLTRRRLFGALLRLGRALRPLLPAVLSDKLATPRAAGAVPTGAVLTGAAPTPAQTSRAVLLLRGCVQPAMLPSIDAATVRVLDSLGLRSTVAASAGCCGAIRHHLDDPAGALDNMRVNIDAWYPYLESGAVDTLVINASGCSVVVKEYGYLLRNDPRYAARAKRVSDSARDVVEFLLPHAATLKSRLAASCTAAAAAVAVQVPCTLQHGQKLSGMLEQLLRQLGVDCVPVAESHLCCGSAGSYSLLHPALAGQLRERKLENLQRASPSIILSDNIGCISHLAAGTHLPVWHWIEWLDRALNIAAPVRSYAEAR
jgi:glycolate oxidase iron-sulfur subunit